MVFCHSVENTEFYFNRNSVKSTTYNNTVCSVEKSSKNTGTVFTEKTTFFRQINVFIKEVTEIFEHDRVLDSVRFHTMNKIVSRI